MDSTSYVKERVETQISWMSKKAAANQKRYKFLKVLEIVLAALIPFLAGYHKEDAGFAIATGILGVLIVVLNGLQQLYKFHENWLTYRTTAEALKREKYLYDAAAEPYHDNHSFSRFVQNIEAILANESKIWKANWTQKAAPKPL